ncbi:MAG: hypothetical protein FJ276_07015 [Planctomycetes bacterium]|nr:hypothetical protein [Planctomycetota bacterium]
MNAFARLLFAVGVLGCCGCLPGAEPLGVTKDQLPAPFDKLVPLHSRLAAPKPGEWLDVHEEPGQTYGEYVKGRPVTPDRVRRAIYIQPMGSFDPAQREVIDITAEFMGIYFGLPVRIRPDVSLSSIPAEARRTHPSWGDKQILTSYVLNRVLRPKLPTDACALIALTTSDLWPGEGWNFVFGQASLVHRVGVWSIYRYGDPNADEKSFRLCLRRTLKTATHETGHMFSMTHCTLYECNMCGSNHQAESDRRPMWLCPHCLAKLCHATGADPQERFRKLISFCKTHGFAAEQTFWQQSLDAIANR